MGDIRGKISEYKALTDRLKANKDFITKEEKAYLKSDIQNLKKEIADKTKEGLERQERVQLALRSGNFTTNNKAIFRINREKVLHTEKDLEKFEGHMLRLYNVPSVNPQLSAYDIVLQGAHSPIDAIEKYYLKFDLKKSKNVRYATEMLYTASPNFFIDHATGDFNFKLIEKWVDATMTYVNAQFPGEVAWAMLHMSETSPHIHALVIAREYHHKWGREIVSHNKYFGNREKLRDLQSSYANFMQRSGFLLERGLIGSKANHKTIARWKAEEKHRDYLIKTSKETLNKKDEEVNKMLEREAIKTKARNKVLRDVCVKYNLNPNELGKAIEEEEKKLADLKNVYVNKKDNLEIKHEK